MTEKQTIEQNIRIEEEHYVNEATLELLTRRIESKAKKNIFQWVGFPVGGAGIIAILVALFVVLPAEVEKYISKVPLAQNAIKEAVQTYIENPDKGKKIIAEKTEFYINTEVTKYFKSEAGQEVLSTTLTQYFDGESGKKLTNEIIINYLESDDAKTLIYNAIEETLKSSLKKMSKNINDKSEQMISKVLSFSKIESFQKGSPNRLQEILDDPEIKKLKDNNTSIALTMPIGRGKIYDPYTMRSYIFELEDYFQDNFKSVLILDENGSFIASVSPEKVKEKCVELRSILMRDFSNNTIREIKTLFGQETVFYLYQDLKLRDALQKPFLFQVENSDVDISVLDKNKQYIGTTSRKKLITCLLQKNTN